jgi:hypothetical protein
MSSLTYINCDLSKHLECEWPFESGELPPYFGDVRAWGHSSVGGAWLQGAFRMKLEEFHSLVPFFLPVEASGYQERAALMYQFRASKVESQLDAVLNPSYASVLKANLKGRFDDPLGHLYPVHKLEVTVSTSSSVHFDAEITPAFSMERWQEFAASSKCFRFEYTQYRFCQEIGVRFQKGWQARCCMEVDVARSGLVAAVSFIDEIEDKDLRAEMARALLLLGVNPSSWPDPLFSYHEQLELGRTASRLWANMRQERSKMPFYFEPHLL